MTLRTLCDPIVYLPPPAHSAAGLYGQTMSEDREYIEANTRQRERLRALVEALDDEALTAPVNEYWTVAGVLGHLAYWDIRFQTLAEKINRGSRGRQAMPSPMATG